MKTKDNIIGHNIFKIRANPKFLLRFLKSAGGNWLETACFESETIPLVASVIQVSLLERSCEEVLVIFLTQNGLQ